MSLSERRCRFCGNLASGLWSRKRVLEGLACEEHEGCSDPTEAEARAEAKAREAARLKQQAEAKAAKKARRAANLAARAAHNKQVCGKPGLAARVPGRGW